MGLKKMKNRGIKVFLVESYVTNKAGDWDNHELYIYYFDKKSRRVWIEDDIDVGCMMKPRQDFGLFYQAWARRTPHRSIPALERGYASDFEKFKNILGSYDLNITELGSL